MPLAEYALGLACEHAATHWPEREATHVWFRTRGVCTALRAVHAGHHSPRVWQLRLSQATADLEVQELGGAPLVVLDDASLDRALVGAARLPLWLRLRSSVKLLVPDMDMPGLTRYQEEAQSSDDPASIPWPRPDHGAAQQRSIVMAVVRAVANKHVRLLVEQHHTSGIHEGSSARGLMPSSSVLRVLHSALRQAHAVHVDVHGPAPGSHSPLSSIAWLHELCLGLEERLLQDTVTLCFHGRAWATNHWHRNYLAKCRSFLLRTALFRSSHVEVTVVSGAAPFSQLEKWEVRGARPLMVPPVVGPSASSPRQDETIVHVGSLLALPDEVLAHIVALASADRIVRLRGALTACARLAPLVCARADHLRPYPAHGHHSAAVAERMRPFTELVGNLLWLTKDHFFHDMPVYMCMHAFHTRAYRDVCDLVGVPPAQSIAAPTPPIDWPEERTCVVIDNEYLRGAEEMYTVAMLGGGTRAVPVDAFELVVAPPCGDDSFDRHVWREMPRGTNADSYTIKNALQDGFVRAGPVRASVTYAYALLKADV